VSDDPQTTPDGIDEPTIRQMFATLIAKVDYLTNAVDKIGDDVQAARHAAAVTADAALEHRQALSRVEDRIDVIDRDGCQHRRLHLYRGNGGNGAG